MSKLDSKTATAGRDRFRLFIKITLWWGVLGPLIGGAPFNWMIYPIPFAYFIGSVPALLGGAVYGAFVTRYGTQVRLGWGTRALGGAASGAVGCLLASLFVSFPFLGLAMFGVPAGVFCALLYKQSWIDRHLHGTTSSPDGPAEPVLAGGGA